MNKNELIAALKEVDRLVNKQSLVVQWFNDNDIEYMHLNDIQMYIIYLENNDIENE